MQPSDLFTAGQGADAVVYDSPADASLNVSHAGGGAGETNVTWTVQVGVDETVADSLLPFVDPDGDGAPATDSSSDGLLNNIDGDVAFGFFDVQASSMYRQCSTVWKEVVQNYSISIIMRTPRG